MNSSLLLAILACFFFYIWRKSKKENDENRKFVILNTLDYYQSIEPEHIAIKVHRKFEAEFLLDPTLLYQIVYSRIINSKYVQCSILFRYDAKEKKFINNLEIWDGQIVISVCPPNLKHHKSSLYEYIVKELESTHSVNISGHNENASNEYNDLALRFLSDKGRL